ncbi:hypothetical protein Celaphus_00009622 [Cervus elaphus hippelaphus]|uniref:Uncharacterized protein n=1 Tax=Cervus elaphus hippelaphus TaxID=46360 RepID=A0A212BZH2_CEREH|nr:hypothetical protein Celaphus_00009622 [Cervus elaphus hippelaphus]
MCPGDALGHMRRCRPTLQPPASPPDCDLTRAPPTRCVLGPNLKSSLLVRVPLLVGPNQGSMEGGQLTVPTSGSFQSGSR